MGSSNGRPPKYVWLEKERYGIILEALCDAYDCMLYDETYRIEKVLSLLEKSIHGPSNVHLFNPQDEPILDAVASGEKMEASVTVRNIVIRRECDEV